MAAAALIAAALAVAIPSSSGSGSADQCHLFPGATFGNGEIGSTTVGSMVGCCDVCTEDSACVAWTWHAKPAPGTTKNCFLKDNSDPEVPPRPVNKHNTTMSGLTGAATSCSEGDPCPGGLHCPKCGSPVCSCYIPSSHKPTAFACMPPHDKLPFCDTSLSVEERVNDLVARVNDSDKANLLTARGLGGNGQHMQALPSLGVPAYYWGTNCLHSLNGGQCVVDSHNKTRCPTNFPSGPSFGAVSTPSPPLLSLFLPLPLSLTPPLPVPPDL